MTVQPKVAEINNYQLIIAFVVAMAVLCCLLAFYIGYRMGRDNERHNIESYMNERDALRRYEYWLKGRDQE